jgi:hypothetical protein
MMARWSIAPRRNNVNAHPRGKPVTEPSPPPRFSRRALLAGAAATPAFGLATPALAQTATMSAAQQARAALKDPKGTKLVLLGTAAGPVPGRSRKMTSHVMLSNGAAYVLDCGLGVTDATPRPASRSARSNRSSSPIIMPTTTSSTDRC